MVIKYNVQEYITKYTTDVRRSMMRVLLFFYCLPLRLLSTYVLVAAPTGPQFKLPIELHLQTTM